MDAATSPTVAPPEVPVLPPAIPVMTIQYATPVSGIDPACRKALGWMVVLAVMSGLCVGVCFFAMSMNLVVAVIHFIVFAATLVIAVRTGIEMRSIENAVGDPSPKIRMVLDAIAGIGLLILAGAPIVMTLLTNNGYDGDHATREWFAQLGFGVLGGAFAMLAATTVRHLLLYRLLGNLCAQGGKARLQKSLLVMGWVKMIYEAIWLSCCAIPLIMAGLKMHDSITGDSEGVMVFFAFAALLGCMGFGAVWIWMIVNHALLRAATGRMESNAR